MTPPAAAPAGALPPGIPLRASRGLSRQYDVALLDLDGVVYVGSQPVPGAASTLSAVRATGMRVAYVTNNASRRPAEVAALLAGMGIPATAAEVVTSAQAAAHLLRERMPPGSRVLVLGTDALAEEVRDAGLTPVRTADPLPAAVVQGYGPTTGWRELAEATVAIRGGAFWVATNTDSTLPSDRGPLPGNGALVAALRVATGAEPDVVGKPHPGLHRESIERTSARRPLVVGDRLDTDIEGAVRAGTDSLLVLSGVTTPELLIAAPDGRRPTYIARDLSGLLDVHPGVTWHGGDAACGGFVAGWRGDELVLSGDGEDALAALRSLCAASWCSGAAAHAVRASTASAEQALLRLGIAAQIGAAADW